MINERLSLLDKESEKLSEPETIRKIITPNIPKEWERDYLLKEGDRAKTLKAAKTILKIIEKADRSKKMEEEPSGKKTPKEQPAPYPTDTNKCRLIGHNHLWKNCPNNPPQRTTMEPTIPKSETRNAPVRPRPLRSMTRVLTPMMNQRGSSRRRGTSTVSAEKLIALTVSIPTQVATAAL